jgi:thiamine biosynthesis protein ThiI
MLLRVQFIREGMEHNKILVRYGEIFLKSDSVRKLYERFLIENVKSHLRSVGVDFTIARERGRLFIETDAVEEAGKELQRVFGIVSFSPCTHVGLNELEKFVADSAQDFVDAGETFKVFVKRVGAHGFTSNQLAARLGEIILDNTEASVDLFDPDREIYVEVRDNDAYVYSDFVSGPGGMPTGTSGRVVSMISGGIDSPVASWMIMKRGCRSIFAHFHSHPMTCSNSIDKAKELVSALDNYQFASKLYLVPFLDVQREIQKAGGDRNSVVLYRRMMTRIAELIARQEKAQAIVTGDSLGQVASQTLTNLEVVNEVAKLPIFRPLIGWDKNDIVGFAKKIGTYDVSVQPHEDNCTLFAPKHPTTRANFSEIREVESKLDIDGMLKAAFENSEVMHYANEERQNRKTAI